MRITIQHNINIPYKLNNIENVAYRVARAPRTNILCIIFYIQYGCVAFFTRIGSIDGNIISKRSPSWYYFRTKLGKSTAAD